MSSGPDSQLLRHRGERWGPAAQSAAYSQLSASLLAVSSLRDIAEAGAEYLRELLKARTVSIIALRDEKYFDVVNVGCIPHDLVRYPANIGYPTWEYPLATKELERFGGYFTTSTDDPRFIEYVRVRDDPEVTSIMGVGLIHGVQLWGEIFYTRDGKRRAFDENDMILARDLGTALARRLAMIGSKEDPSTVKR